MGILENIKNFFRSNIEEEIKTEPETKEEIPVVLKPIFEEIAPDMNKGEFLKHLRSWGFIALSALADEISTAKLRLLKESGDGWEEVMEHPALELVENPNPYQTREELLWMETIYLGAEGEAPLLFNKGNNPTEMILLLPQKLTLIYDSKKLIGSYKYQKSDGSMLRIPAEELVLLKYPNLINYLRGTGFMSYIAKSLNLDTFTETYLNNFFFNSAMPTGVLETEHQLNNEIVKRIRHQWEKRHKGVQKAHKVAILEKGLKYNRTGYNLNDLDIKGLEGRIRDKILATFKVPKSVLGITEDVNRASAEAANNSFQRNAIRPRLRLLEAQLNKFILPKFAGTEKMRFEFDDPVREDEKLKAEINKIYLDAGVIGVDEVRAELGLGPLGNEEETPAEETPTEETPPKEESKGSKVMAKIIKDIMAKNKPSKLKYSDKEIEDYHNQKIIFTNNLEDELKGKLVRYFEKINNRVLVSIKKKEIINGGEITIDYDLEGEAQTLAKVTSPILEKTIEKQSGLTFALMGMESNLTGRDELVKRFIEKRALEFSTEVSNKTKKDLKRVIKTWNLKEESVPILRKRLSDYFGNAEKTRVDTIARTEVSRAAGFATLETYKEVGVVGKKWVTAADERVCQFCEPMDGKTIPIDKNFWNKGAVMGGRNQEGINGELKFDLEGVNSYPLHPRCRCNLVPIFDSKEMPRDPFAYQRESERRLASRDRELQQREELMLREDEVSFKEKQLKKKSRKIKSEAEKIKTSDKEIDEKKLGLEKKDKRLKKEIKQVEKLWKKI